ncbi:hypothetical protein [Shivajiella indica]|uniref:Antitoxin component YwqK of the YwqJK toxin-antitoxin module n=1 Tax=Shivajiella indica TaxID=872115 RepID=A0ABW5B580_9BACT
MKHLLLLILFVISPLILFSQEVYKGNYQFNGLSGSGNFEFVKGEGNTIIKQGEFRFLRKERDPQDKTVLYKTEIFGLYEEDKKSGIWEYQDEKHEVTLNDIDAFKLIYDINSQQIKLKANYKSGVPDGRWVFEENEFREGKLFKKAEAEDFLFRNGDIQGKFQYKTFVGDKTHFIRGELNKEGFMNGEWTFVYQKDGKLVSEVRNYENGFLLGVIKRDLVSDELLEEVVFFQTIKKLKLLNSNENKGFRESDEKFGILFNDGFLSGSEHFRVQEDGNKFITEFLTNVLRYDDQYVSQNGELVDYPLHTKKFVFELSRSQQRIVEDLPSKFDKLQTTIRDYSERNALNLNKQKSDTLSFAYAFFQFQVKKLDEFTEIINLLRTKEIQYYDIQNLIEEGLPFLTERDNVNYIFENRQIQKQLEYKVGDVSSDFYEALSSYIDQVEQKTSELKAYVDKSLSRIERDEDLRNIQNQIQSKKDDLEQKYYPSHDFDELTNNLIKAVYDNILVEGFNNLNERYAKEENFGGKKEIARVMLDLLDEMENQFRPIIDLSKKVNQMDGLYMEEVFNPFTYTRYDQRAKNRLYESGEKVLTHYLDGIKGEKEYTEIKVWLNKTSKLFERMGELREADTRNLERKINRRLSVSKIESLLEL